MISLSSRYTKKMSGIFVFVFLICLIHSIGSGGILRPDVSEAVGISEAVALDNSNPGIQTAIAAQDRHTDILLGEPGVVGTAVGLTGGGKPAILVLVTSFNEAKAANIPSDIEGVPVIVKITGEIVALKKPDNPGHGGGGGGSEENLDPTSRFARPVPIGVSTGHPDITAGTIGCRVIDINGNVYALSNNHVYANQNNATIGNSVIQPGAYDGGSSPDDVIGTLFDFEQLDFTGSPTNTIDAAIALSSTASLGNATPSNGYGTPKSTTVAAVLNGKVMKYGRTTGLTKGSIAGINVTVDVNYGDGNIARFINQILIQPGSFSAGGDSGSLIVTDSKGRDKAGKGKPVGLLFAGSNIFTIANPIADVLTRFGVTIDGN